MRARVARIIRCVVRGVVITVGACVVLAVVAREASGALTRI
eukprot:COSAG06_NODE_27189_length_598_cov_1.941884_1_plen_40_part_10